MSTSLTLVVDNSAAARNTRAESAPSLEKDPRIAHPSGANHQRRLRRQQSITYSRAAWWRIVTPLRGERGAVTAEYAIVIMAAVAFAGLLVAIMRSGEIRAMLVELVQNALGSAG